MAAASAQKRIALSFRKDDLGEGGGLPTKFWGTVAKGVYEPFEYPKSAKRTMMFRLEIDPDDGQEGFDYEKWGTVVNHWSVGDATKYAPSLDGIEPIDISEWDGKPETIEDYQGRYLVPLDSGVVIKRNCNFVHGVESFIDAGFPEADIPDDGDASVFEGIRAFWERLPQKERTGLKSDTGDAAQAGPKTILLPTEIKAAKKANKSKTSGTSSGGAKSSSTASTSTSASGAKAKATVKPAPPDDADADGSEESVEARLEAALAKQIAKSDEPLSKPDRVAVVTNPRNGFEGPDKKAAIKLIGDDAWLGHKSRPWMYDGEESTIAARDADAVDDEDDEDDD